MAGTPDPSGIAVQAASVAASQNIVVQARPAPAFQGNAFFNPAFQTTQFSQSAFQQCAFSHQGFQTDECISGGRSGYWRLFFTQMQEEALKQDAESKTTTERPVESTKPAPEKVKAKAKPKRKAVEKAVNQPQPIEVPQFRLKPLYEQPNTYDALADLPPIMLTTYSVATLKNQAIINLEHERLKRRKQARRRAAAFLLLAA